MVHGAGQQLARRSIRLWVVAACLFGTREILAVPRPGEFAGTLDDNGNPVVNDDWQFATVSRIQGIMIPWLCVSFIPRRFVTKRLRTAVGANRQAARQGGVIARLPFLFSRSLSRHVSLTGI
jgi:predicted ABC-type sugar transport system permease subunit